MARIRAAAGRTVPRRLSPRLVAAGSALTIVVATMLSPGGARAQEPLRTVVVLEYLARNGSAGPPDFGQLVKARVRDELEMTGRATVVAESLLASALSSLGFEASDVTSLGRASTLADTTGADAVVFGTFESYGSVLKVTSQLATKGASHLRVVEVAEHLASRTPEEIAGAVAAGLVPLVVPPLERSVPSVGPPGREDLVVGARRKPIKWGAWTSLAVAAGAAYGAFSWHQNSGDEWDEYLRALDPDKIRTHYDNANRYLTWRNVSFGVVGAAALSALYYFYYKDYGATEEWASLLPIPTVDLSGDRVSVGLMWKLPGSGRHRR